MHKSQIDIAYKKYALSIQQDYCGGIEKSAMLKLITGLAAPVIRTAKNVWGTTKAVAQNPGVFAKSLGRRTLDSGARTFEGGKRFFGAMSPSGARNTLQRSADARLMGHQNFGGGMSGFGSSPLSGNLVEDKFFINHAFNNMNRRSMQAAFRNPTSKGIVGKAPEGFSDWVANLNQHQRDLLIKTLPSRPQDAASAMRKYVQGVYGAPLNRLGGSAADEFSRMYSRYGRVAGNQSANTAEVIGNRLGNIAGPLGITLPAVFAPTALSSWEGAAGAGSKAKDIAARAGRQAVADDMYQFENMPMMSRLQMMWDPQSYLKQMYQSPHSMPSALAHHYMYGAGRNERIQDPGITDYLKHLAFPLFAEDPLQRSIQAKGVRGMQEIPDMMRGGLSKAAGFMRLVPKVFGAFRTPGKLMTGTANTLKSLGIAKNVAGRTLVSGGAGGIANVMAGDENSNAFNRFLVGAGAGAGLGFGGNKFLRKGFQYANKNISPTLRRLGAASSKEYGRNMHWLARQSLPGSGNSQLMQNLAGTAYKIRRHPILTAAALYTPYSMYDSYQQGRQATLGAAEEMGAAGGHATVADMMANQSFFPRMMAALNPAMAAGALQEADPAAYNQYMQRKMNPVDMENNGMPYYAR